jgi:hypothetical protein
MKKTLRLVAPLLMLTAMACSKKDKAPTKTDMLTSSSWKMTALREDNDGDGNFETDAFATLPSCSKDDVITFKANGQMTWDEGGSKCDPADPQSETLTWSFSNNETTLVIDSDPYTIEELSNANLKLKQVVAGVYGVSISLSK